MQKVYAVETTVTYPATAFGPASVEKFIATNVLYSEKTMADTIVANLSRTDPPNYKREVREFSIF
jgi:hypothetical protein